MNKHILDRPAVESDGKIVRTFAEVERLSGEGPSDAAMTLLRRAQDRPPTSSRMAQYTRIDSERG